MTIAWTPDLAVGVSQIDEEHKELFERVNALLLAMREARAKEQLAPLMGFLDDYVTTHFGNETRLMQQYRYPQAAGHLEEHHHFTQELKRMAAELDRGGPTALLTIKLNKLLCEWLRDHVSGTDKRLGQFLAAAGVTARA